VIIRQKWCIYVPLKLVKAITVFIRPNAKGVASGAPSWGAFANGLRLALSSWRSLIVTETIRLNVQKKPIHGKNKTYNPLSGRECHFDYRG
jgi:hypothetical protein